MFTRERVPAMTKIIFETVQTQIRNLPINFLNRILSYIKCNTAHIIWCKCLAVRTDSRVNRTWKFNSFISIVIVHPTDRPMAGPWTDVLSCMHPCITKECFVFVIVRKRVFNQTRYGLRVSLFTQLAHYHALFVVIHPILCINFSHSFKQFN